MNQRIIAFTAALVLAATAAFSATKTDVHTALDTAISTIEKMGVDAGIAYIREPKNGMHELEDTGLHIWAIDALGHIVFDNSGQTQAGMDVSVLPMLADGTGTLQAVLKMAQTYQTANVQEGVVTEFPHPTSMEMGTAYIACRDTPFDANLYVCGMAWGF